ncbi:MAG: hypothetical protein JWO45_1744, partial [Spartobacteria bacterium]|nr:hypothetical protein [Spartobacteria bacterium]
MKTLSGTAKILLLVSIAALLVFTFRAFAQSPQPSEVKYTEKKISLKLKDDVEVLDEAKFQTTLCKLDPSQFKIHMKHKDPNKPDEDWPPCPKMQSATKRDNIETTSIVKGAQADNLT